VKLHSKRVYISNQLDLDIVNTAIEAATNIKTEMEAQFAAMTDDAMHA
jgi:hypothetical protein